MKSTSYVYVYSGVIREIRGLGSTIISKHQAAELPDSPQPTVHILVATLAPIATYGAPTVLLVLVVHSCSCYASTRLEAYVSTSTTYVPGMYLYLLHYSCTYHTVVCIGCSSHTGAGAAGSEGNARVRAAKSMLQILEALFLKRSNGPLRSEPYLDLVQVGTCSNVPVFFLGTYYYNTRYFITGVLGTRVTGSRYVGTSRYTWYCCV